MPEELVHPEKYPDLFNDQKIDINSDPPNRQEIKAALKSFKNGKSSGTDKIPTEALKYGISSNLLIVAIWMLLNTIWLTLSIPTEWLKLSLTCLFKKGCKQLASNYRALTVGANISKILSKIITTRLKESYETNISNEQFGFRQDRSTTDGVFIMRQILKNTEGVIIALYIDLTAAFDKVPRHIMYEVLKIRTGCKKLIDILWLLYDGTSGNICGDAIDFPIEAGTRQGGIESPTVFNWFFDWVLKVAAYEIDQCFPNGWGIQYTYAIANACHQRNTGRMNGTEMIRWLLYADDVVVFSNDLSELQAILDIIHRTCSRYGLQISFKKTKTQVFNDSELVNKKSLLNISGEKIENVKGFKYLGHMIYSDQKDSFVDNRILSATSKFHDLKHVLTDHKVSMVTRKKILESCVRSRLTYCTEAQLPNGDELRKLESCWHGLLRRMIKNGWKRKSNNEGEDTFAFKYKNSDIERIIGTIPLRDFIYVRYLKYIAHICRRPNSHLTKRMLFVKPTAKYVRDPWIKIEYLLNIDKEQAKRSTRDRKIFNGLLLRNFDSLQN